jgi:hypothetical protein
MAKPNNPLHRKMSADMQVIQFHTEHRCATCLKIEELTKKTLASHFSDYSLLPD